MRTFGGVLLFVGIFGFFYCTTQLSSATPLPEGLNMSDSLRYPAGRWEVARYACAFGGALGALMALFPKGR